MLIVVTGAQGFLGRRLVARLASEGMSVLAVDQRAAVGATVPGVQCHVSDLSDPDTLVPPGCDTSSGFVLVHLAWDMRRPDSAYCAQAEQVTRLAGLLDTWTTNGLHYVLVPGSAQEYGARSGRIGEEDLPVPPLSPYGWAKRSAYEMAHSWADRAGIGVLWLRPFIVYGPRQGGGMVVPYAVRQAAAKERAEFTDAEQKRDFVYVDDVIEAMIAGLRRRPNGFNAVNLGCAEPVRVRDVLAEIARLLGAEERFVYGVRQRRQGEPDEQVADIRRAAGLLGWRPTVDWREGIRRLCESAGS